MADAIQIEAVTVRRDGVTILENVTASVPKGSVTAIIGPNGAGKTTLLYAVLGLIPYQGKVRFLAASGRQTPSIGYVPQSLDFDRGAPITVLDFLAMGRQRVPVWFGVRPWVRQLAEKNLDRVQAKGMLNKPLGRLSGGELQRVQLALALQSNPEILLLDEPVSGIDVAGERLFCDLLEQIHLESALTMVMVSHDLSVVSRHARHVICLNRTVQCQGPTPVVMTSANLAAIYGPHMGLYDHHGPVAHGHAHAGPCSHDHHEPNDPKPAPKPPSAIRPVPVPNRVEPS